ncbi:hypothetical protein BD311DRAFT_123227 [Dichomitus squalens]|uniref:Uncharacterized protein n=1 Tax=Dichomitus squalens TaxID=114155 RepID=A0A4Q9MW65_9APHY|nr:hypothetical protein BD311DRAFT_123227 [Dichomitus squalens]
MVALCPPRVRSIPPPTLCFVYPASLLLLPSHLLSPSSSRRIYSCITTSDPGQPSGAILRTLSRCHVRSLVISLLCCHSASIPNQLMRTFIHDIFLLARTRICISYVFTFTFNVQSPHTIHILLGSPFSSFAAPHWATAPRSLGNMVVRYFSTVVGSTKRAFAVVYSSGSRPASRFAAAAAATTRPIWVDGSLPSPSISDRRRTQGGSLGCSCCVRTCMYFTKYSGPRHYRRASFLAVESSPFFRTCACVRACRPADSINSRGRNCLG